MIFLHADDTPEIIECKLTLANVRYYLDMTHGHRAELDRAIEDCWRRWDAITNTKEAI